MGLAASARCGGLLEGLLALKGRSPRLGRDGGRIVPSWEEGRIKPELARIIGYFPRIVIASRCTTQITITRAQLADQDESLAQ